MSGKERNKVEPWIRINICVKQKQRTSRMYIHWLQWKGINELKNLINQIYEILAFGSGICVVKNVPLDDDNVTYLLIAKAFGGELLRDLRMPVRSLEANSVIYRVEEDPLNTDEYAYSATNAHFSLHTDCAHFLYPAQIMMLLCCRPSMNEGDGKTILTDVEDVLTMLTEQQVSDLLTKQFIWWQQEGSKQVRTPILSKTNSGQWRIRFNQATLMREMDDNEFSKASELQALIDVLQKIEANSNNLISLSTGDLLILHNQRVLHGRTAFASNSSRLLKRIRMRVPNL